MTKKALIVDDNSANLYLLDSLLRGFDMEVTSAINGKDALNKARLNPPDLIISDILMPVMDGYALCRQCKSDDQLKHIPFVFYTSTYTEAKDEDFALGLGAERFIIKPQEPEILLNILKEVMGKKSVTEKTVTKPLGEDMEFFRRHNETLFMKLEKKMLDLEIANQKLKLMEESYRLSFENITDLIYVIDKDFKIASMSPSVERILGYHPRDFIGQPVSAFNNILAPESLRQTLEDMSLVFKGETIPAKIYQFMAKDGTMKHGEVIESAVLREGKIISMIAVARDITDRKRAEERLQQTLSRLKKAIGTTIQVMVSAVEARDPYTSGHQNRSADLARAIAVEMKLSQDNIDAVRVAGSIHDIGKLSVPAEILSKPTKLTDIEFSLVKEHSRKGFEILKEVESAWPLAEIVLQHHERMNGSGYPRNLKGDDILIEARILGVADVVEAMASHRPYRPSLGIDAALKEIETNRGVLYDRDVVDACLRLFREKSYHLLDRF